MAKVLKMFMGTMALFTYPVEHGVVANLRRIL
jgi:hypothetical protein